MTIAYPLDLPTATRVRPRGMKWTSQNVNAATAAPFSGQEQIQSFPGKWWELEMTFPPMSARNGQIWCAWLASLNGYEGTFLIGNFKSLAPRGSAAVTPGTPQVDGAGQTGLALKLKTTLGNVAGYLLAGDFFSIGAGVTRRLHMVTQDVDLVAGKATASIWPRLREVPANSAAVFLTNTTGLFRLAINAPVWNEDEVGNIQIDPIPIREAI